MKSEENIMRVLLIEDDEALCVGIKIHLETYGYDVEYCGDGEDGLEFMRRQAHDLVILDRMLPSMDGMSIIKKARNEGIHIPVIMLTALSDIKDKVEGLEAGADDYLPKPFAMEELVARIKALSRRPVQWEASNTIRYGDLILDVVNHKLTGPSGECSLSKKECRLAEVLIKNQNQTLSREQIFYKVWGVDTFVEDANLDNYIHFVRKRMKTVGSHTKIKTVHGIGYTME